ncbi:cytochrome P450 [Mycena crocata]|nr:cytochrome P450 [Mycena crocata]
MSFVLLAYGFLAATTLSWLWHRQKQQPVPPLVGSDGLWSSYIAAFQFLGHSLELVHQGYDADHDGVYRIPRLFRWDYVVCGPKRTAEVVAASDDVLSFQHGAEDILQGDYTMGPEITLNPYHQYTVRGSLTRNIGRCLPQMHDEFVCAFEEVLALKGTEWKEITVLPTMMQVVARTSGRVFVGLPLCRNQDYVDLSISYTVDVFTRAQIIVLFPNILKPIFGRLLSSRRSSLRRALKLIGPLIEERMAKEEELGKEWSDRPNDYISWLLDDAEGAERKPAAIALRVLATNTAAIHTSSNTLTTALYDLTTYPSHIPALREEAARVVGAEGWTKTALGNMHKIDSFLRESQRVNGAGPVSLMRKVVAKDGFTFSDGTVLPRGAYVSVASRPAQYDPVILTLACRYFFSAANYENPDVFDGFRFSREREATADRAKEREAGTGPAEVFKNHMITTNANHLVFGHGKHACPGRFFAAAELKAMLAHILLNYDIRAEKEGVRPPDFVFGMINGPNAKGKIWMRRRGEGEA